MLLEWLLVGPASGGLVLAALITALLALVWLPLSLARSPRRSFTRTHSRTSEPGAVRLSVAVPVAGLVVGLLIAGAVILGSDQGFADPEPSDGAVAVTAAPETRLEPSGPTPTPDPEPPATRPPAEAQTPSEPSSEPEPRREPSAPPMPAAGLADDYECFDAMYPAKRVEGLVGLPLPPGWRLVIECTTDPAEWPSWPDGSYSAGEADTVTSQLFVWPPATTSLADLEFTLLHEIGHAYDWEYLNPQDRETWAEHRGMSTPPWWGREGQDHAQHPAEDFAESFAACYSGDADYWMVEGPPPDEAACELLGELIAR